MNKKDTKKDSRKMASGNRNHTNTSQELVIDEPMTWDLANTGEDVNHPAAIVCNPPA
jgi:hypothetical protein